MSTVIEEREPQSFEDALREQLNSRPKTARTRALRKLLDAKPSRLRTRILERLERHVIVEVEAKTGKSLPVGANGKIDWSKVDWAKLFESVLTIVIMLLPFFL